MRLVSIFVFITCFLILASCTVKKDKDIIYKGKLSKRDNLLDVYYPRKKTKPKDVLVFIHGGSWNSGSKNIYWWLGRNFARKGIVTIIINYPLAPENTYDVMAYNSACAVKWVVENVNSYGEDPKNIYLIGHSAGAHLAALLALDDRFFKSVGVINPTKGVIINDAFGLDMFQYLMDSKSKPKPYGKIFTGDSAVWKQASPYYHIKGNKFPFSIYTGENTYDTIKIQSSVFRDKLLENGVQADFREIRNKKHIGMMTQMLFGWNKRYREIISFIEKNK